MKPSFSGTFVHCTVPNGFVQDDFLNVYEKMQENVVQRSRLDRKPGWHLLLAFGRTQTEVCQTV